MMRIQRRLEAGAMPGSATNARLTLAFSQRCTSRLRVTLDDRRDAGLFLPRGTVLRGGDLLVDDTGTPVLVVAAQEELYEVTAAEDAADPHFDLMRAAYHLGNRHVPVQLAPRGLRLERDTVLREMLLRLGVRVAEIVAPFEPEAGAYGGGHRHDHDAPGGMLGERLSREAHAASDPPDFASMHFVPAPTP